MTDDPQPPASPEDVIEAEWYNGNLSGGARDRLLASLQLTLPARQPAPSEGLLVGLIDAADRYRAHTTAQNGRDLDAAITAANASRVRQSAPSGGLHREAVWGPDAYHPGYGKGVCEVDGQPWPCDAALADQPSEPRVAALAAGLAVNLRVPLSEVDDWARRLVEADGRVTDPWLTDDERRAALDRQKDPEGPITDAAGDELERGEPDYPGQ